MSKAATRVSYVSQRITRMEDLRLQCLSRLGGIRDRENDPRFRPVAQYAADNAGGAGATSNEWRTRGLECDLNTSIYFKQFIGSKQQSGFAQVDGFTHKPVLGSGTAKS